MRRNYLTYREQDIILETLIDRRIRGLLEEQYLTEGVSLGAITNILNGAFKGFKNLKSCVDNTKTGFDMMKHFSDVSKKFGGAEKFIKWSSKQLNKIGGGKVYKVLSGSSKIANEVVTSDGNGNNIWLSDLAVGKQMANVKSIVNTAISTIAGFCPGFGKIVGAVIAGFANVLVDIGYNISDAAELTKDFLKGFYEALVPDVLKNLIGKFLSSIGESISDAAYDAKYKERNGTDLIRVKGTNRYIKASAANRESTRAQQERQSALEAQENAIDNYLECRERHSWAEFSEWYKRQGNGNTVQMLDSKSEYELRNTRYKNDSGTFKAGDLYYWMSAWGVTNSYEQWKKSVSLGPRTFNQQAYNDFINKYDTIPPREQFYSIGLGRNIDAEDRQWEMNQSLFEVKASLYDTYKQCSAILKDYDRKGLIPALIWKRVQSCTNEDYGINQRFFSKLENMDFNATDRPSKVAIVDKIWSSSVVYNEEYDCAVVHGGIESTCELILSKPQLTPISEDVALANIRDLKIKKEREAEMDMANRERQYDYNHTFANDATAVRNQPQPQLGIKPTRTFR